MPHRYDAPSQVYDRARRRFHVMAKPVGPACNLACTYCYYLDKATLPGGSGTGRMDDGTLEAFVRQYLDGVNAGDVVFSWQGGEPTLLGVDFFRKAVALQRRYARPDQVVHNDLQTNGTLLDETWASFLAEHRFLVGLSVDGPAAEHDRFRIHHDGAPSHASVVRAATLLHRYAIPFASLTCVHRANADRPEEIYRFLRTEIGAPRVQFIPVVEYVGFERTAPQRWDAARMPRLGEPRARPGHPDSSVTDWSVDPDAWGRFLCGVFDAWRARDVGRVFVDFVENLVGQRLGHPSQVCVHAEVCGKNLAIEHDGAVYACDHYVYPEHRRGNVRDGDLGRMAFDREQVRFGYAKSETLPGYCRACPHLRECQGECPKNRFLRTPDGEPGLNYLCSGFRRFFAHATPIVDGMVAALRAADR